MALAIITKDRHLDDCPDTDQYMYPDLNAMRSWILEISSIK